MSEKYCLHTKTCKMLFKLEKIKYPFFNNPRETVIFLVRSGPRKCPIFTPKTKNIEKLFVTKVVVQ